MDDCGGRNRTDHLRRRDDCIVSYASTGRGQARSGSTVRRAAGRGTYGGSGPA